MGDIQNKDRIPDPELVNRYVIDPAIRSVCTINIQDFKVNVYVYSIHDIE